MLAPVEERSSLERGAPAQGLFAFPAKIQLQTINRCNYECPMCPYPEVAHGREAARLEEVLFHRLVDEVAGSPHRVKLCLMLQNEPLLDRRFVEFVAHAHAADEAVSSISTVTNGSVLTEELLDRLMTFERFHLTVSVNAVDGERYARIHGRDLWRKVHDVLRRWGGPRRRVRLSFVLDGDSMDDARRFQDHWGELGYATRLVPINARVDSMDVPARLHEADYDYGHCHYPVDTLNVLTDGSVILCCNDWQHHDRYGNLHDAGVQEIWNSPELTRLRTLAIRGQLRQMPMCKACDYPLRSSRRVVLEAMVAEPGEVPEASGELPTTSHRTLLETGDGHRLAALVWGLDAEAGTVDLVVLDGAEPLAGPVRLELRIGHSGAFSFGSLESAWCHGEVRPGEVDLGVDGVVPYRVRLDPRDEGFQLFPWYCADWKAA